MILNVKCWNCKEETSVKVKDDLFTSEIFTCPCCGVQFFITASKLQSIDDNISNLNLTNEINNLSLTEIRSRNEQSRKR